MAPQQWTPTPGRQETSQATPYWQQVYPPRCTTGVQMTTPKPSTAPSTSQGRDEMARGSEEVGPHLEGLKAETGEIDPPPEDLESADEASIVTTLWMICLTMWPQAGNETSLK